mmetsp:Transcript_85485/g.161067  ORF Transcript_85485/g.161067 Transcript_85485/m.161067 type:complete len:846 (-) Transcript_85485:15-2552(-)
MPAEGDPGEGCAAAPAPQADNAQPGGSGLRALSAEDKGRIGQLIKVLAQERRDKESFRQELNQEKARIQELQRERDSGRQQERALVARVSSALQLLRKYQEELYLAHGSKDRAEKQGGLGARAAAASPPTALPSGSVKSSSGMEVSAQTAPAHTAASSSAPGLPKAWSSAASAASHPALSPSAAGSHSRGDVGMPAGVRQPPANCSASKVSPPPSPISSSASERPRLRSPSPAVLASAEAARAAQAEQAQQLQTEVPVLTPSSSHSSAGRQSRFTSLGVLQQPQLKLLQRYLHIQQGGDGSAAERAVAAATAAAALEVAQEAADGGTTSMALSTAESSFTESGGGQREGNQNRSSHSRCLRSHVPVKGAWPEPAANAWPQEDPRLLVVTPAAPPLSSAPAAPLRSPAARPGTRPASAAVSPVTPPAAAAAAAQVQSPLAQPGWKPLAPAPGAVPTPSLFPPALGAEGRQRMSTSLPRAAPQPVHQRETLLDKAHHEDSCSWTAPEGDTSGNGLQRSSRSPLARFSAVSWGRARPPLRGRSGSPRRSVESAQRSTPSTPGAATRRSLPAASLEARAPTTPPRNQPRSPPATQSPEPLLQSPSLRLRSPVQHRASRGSSMGTARSSWAVCIDDGYYGPAMFDVLDSVESAISLGSSFLSSTAASSTSSTHPRRSSLSAARRAARDSTASSRGGTRGAEDLRRLQRELAELERRVYGPGTTEAASSTEALLLGSSRDTLSRGARLSHEPLPPSSPPRPLQRSSLGEGSWTPGPADIAPSTPPRKSREFDVFGAWQEAPQAPAPPPWAPPPWPRHSAKAASSMPAPKLDEIDDVLHLLERAPVAEPARS